MKKQLNVEIGGRIRKTREALGYSRETLAEKADLASSFIGTIELGAGSFTAETLIKLCRALGTSADYILFGREEQGDLPPSMPCFPVSIPDIFPMWKSCWVHM